MGSQLWAKTKEGLLCLRPREKMPTWHFLPNKKREKKKAESSFCFGGESEHGNDSKDTQEIMSGVISP